nr:MAG TPA: hypothetical protein [Caudoviricetes sp.]
MRPRMRRREIKATALAANNVNFLALSKLWVADALGILNKSIRGI